MMQLAKWFLFSAYEKVLFFYKISQWIVTIVHSQPKNAAAADKIFTALENHEITHYTYNIGRKKWC